MTSLVKGVDTHVKDHITTFLYADSDLLYAKTYLRPLVSESGILAVRCGSEYRYPLLYSDLFFTLPYTILSRILSLCSSF